MFISDEVVVAAAAVVVVDVTVVGAVVVDVDAGDAPMNAVSCVVSCSVDTIIVVIFIYCDSYYC